MLLFHPSILYFLFRFGFLVIISALLSSFIGLMGFLVFLFFFSFFISFFYIFRIRTIQNKEIKITYPCDGVILDKSKRINVILDREMSRICIKSDLFDQYGKYSPMDGIVTKIEYIGKEAKEYKNCLGIIIDNSQIRITIIIKPKGIFNSFQDITLDIQEGDMLRKGDLIGWSPFSSINYIFFDGNLDLVDRIGSKVTSCISNFEIVS